MLLVQRPDILWLWLTMSRGGCYVLMLVFIFISKISSQFRLYWSLSRKVGICEALPVLRAELWVPSLVEYTFQAQGMGSVKQGWFTPPRRLPLRIMRTCYGEPPPSDTCNRPELTLANGTYLQLPVISEIRAQLLEKGEQHAVGLVLVTRLGKIPTVQSPVDQQ